jgi:hypothetical protein
VPREAKHCSSADHGRDPLRELKPEPAVGPVPIPVSVLALLSVHC